MRLVAIFVATCGCRACRLLLALPILLAACAGQTPVGAPPGIAPQAAGSSTIHRGRFPYLRTVSEHWDLQVDRTDDGKHPAVLRWEMGARTAEGTLEPGEDAYYASHYRGRFRVDGVERRATLHVLETACTDDADAPHALRIELTVEGLSPFDSGCGDFILPDTP